MRGDETGYVWVQDRSPGETSIGAQIVVSELANGLSEFDLYNTWTGTYHTGPVVVSTAGNAITTTIPDFANDVACRLTWRGPSTHTLTMSVASAGGGPTSPPVGVHV
jgi:hypothetical protein